MERFFGVRLGSVRVHTDVLASRSVADVSASAYTLGYHIVFAPGAYQPQSAEGRSLLAHELAHVVQAGSTGLAGGHGTTVGDVDAPEEESAARAASAARSIPAVDNPPVQRAATPQPLRRQQATETPQAPAAPAPEGEGAHLAEAGLISLGQVLQAVAAPEGEYLRGLYNEGAQVIAAETARLRALVDAGSMTEEAAARTLSGMRHELALKVRRTGSALFEAGAELFDKIRGNIGRPAYDALKAAGKTDAEIMQSAAKTNEFINRLPRRLRWAGRGLWVAQAGISIYVILSAPAGQRGQVAQQEAEGAIGGVAGAGIGEGVCIVFAIATEGLGLILCGLVGGFAGAEAARHGHLLQILDIAPHTVPELSGRTFRVEGCWDESDFFIFSVCGRTLTAADRVLVVATGRRSGEMIGGSGHYRETEVTPASDAATSLFGGNETRWVKEYLLVPATAADLAHAD